MSIVTTIESHFDALRAKVGTLSADLEQHIESFLGLAKAEEEAAEAKVRAEIEHLKSLGYDVKAPNTDQAASGTVDASQASAG